MISSFSSIFPYSTHIHQVLSLVGRSLGPLLAPCESQTDCMMVMVPGEESPPACFGVLGRVAKKAGVLLREKKEKQCKQMWFIRSSCCRCRMQSYRNTFRILWFLRRVKGWFTPSGQTGHRHDKHESRNREIPNSKKGTAQLEDSSSARVRVAWECERALGAQHL